MMLPSRPLYNAFDPHDFLHPTGVRRTARQLRIGSTSRLWHFHPHQRIRTPPARATVYLPIMKARVFQSTWKCLNVCPDVKPRARRTCHTLP